MPEFVQSTVLEDVSTSDVDWEKTFPDFSALDKAEKHDDFEAMNNVFSSVRDQDSDIDDNPQDDEEPDWMKGVSLEEENESDDEYYASRASKGKKLTEQSAHFDWKVVILFGAATVGLLIAYFVWVTQKESVEEDKELELSINLVDNEEPFD